MSWRCERSSRELLSVKSVGWFLRGVCANGKRAFYGLASIEVSARRNIRFNRGRGLMVGVEAVLIPVLLLECELCYGHLDGGMGKS
jgi:hypothetical protein